MNNITIRRISGKNIEPKLISGIVHVFRDDEVVPWHRYNNCLAWVTRRSERGFYIALAYNANQIVGYSEWIETYDGGKKILYLGIMQVDCELRGRGIGKAMLDDGEKYAESISASCLRTIPEDERAHDFYRKYGFTETDAIYYCICPTNANGEVILCDNPAPVTLEIANTYEFIFGLCQSSGRHMYEVANHNPDSDFAVKTGKFPDGYLQFRYRKGTKIATALYWSKKNVTAETVSAILTSGFAEKFEDIHFYFKTKYLPLFTGENVLRESVEIERKINI